MGIVNGRITAPVGVDSDVPEALGIASTDVGVQCRNGHGKTNIWAKYKPINHSSVPDLTESVKELMHYGMVPLMSRQIADIVAAYAAAEDGDVRMNGWAYEPPVGGALSTYRVNDWIGYWPSAINAVFRSVVQTDKVGNTSKYKISINGVLAETAEGQLTLNDVFPNWYIGVAIYTTSRYYYKASAQLTASTVGYTIEMDVDGVPADTYKIMPIVAQNACIWSGNVRENYNPPGTQMFATLPNAEMKEIEIAEGNLAEYRITLAASWGHEFTPVSEDGGELMVAASYDYTLINVTLNILDIQEGVTLRNNRLLLVRNGVVVDYEMLDDIENRTSYNRIHQFYRDYAMGYSVQVSLGGIVRKETMVLTPM